jgi:MOSC domain-containing protein YiiM
MATGPASLAAVNLGQVRDDIFTGSRTERGAKPATTGIDKRPAPGPVRLQRLGVVGDSVCDTKHHGGVDQAVYAYADEDRRWWQDELGGELSFALRPGSFGENLTTEGLDVTGAVVGEQWVIGSAVLEVCVPRLPCNTFAAFWNVDKLVKRFTAAGRPGAYLRVLSEGSVQQGDEISVRDRPAHGVTIAETFRALTGDRSLASRLLTAPQLPDDVQASARTWLAG